VREAGPRVSAARAGKRRLVERGKERDIPNAGGLDEGEDEVPDGADERERDDEDRPVAPSIPQVADPEDDDEGGEVRRRRQALRPDRRVAHVGKDLRARERVSEGGRERGGARGEGRTVGRKTGRLEYETLLLK